MPLRPAVAAALAATLAAACGPSGGAAPAAKSPDQVKAELPAPFNGGDVAAGKLLFQQCAACHTVTQGGANMVGPNLYGVFGAKAGGRPDAFAYSDDLKATGWTWDAAAIDRWITDPRALLPKTKMVFIGIKDAKQRADLIAYLKVATSGGPS